MKATIKELKRTMLDIDFSLIVNENSLTNSEGRRFLYEIKNQDLEVDFYIGSAGTFVIETKVPIRLEDFILIRKIIKK